jgi:hypothetical protein
MSEQVEMSGSELFRLFVHPRATRGEVAALSLDKATQMIEYRRNKLRKEPAVAALKMTDEQIARAILAYARGPETGTSAEGLKAGVVTDAQLLSQILVEQRSQTRYLKQINTVVQIWGVLLILGIVLGCIAILLGGSPF